jgi:ABC-type glycerol-3-phosphate transport system substrate-binding protein
MQRKLALISFDAYPESDFKQSFIQGAEILLTKDGTYGLPFLVDPLVMYYNRDILNSNGVAAAPTSWEQILALSEKLTVLSEDRTIQRSTVPFGDYSNVTHAKDILATLMIQSGNPLVIRDSAGKIKNIMAENGGAAVSPIETALDFYTQFADPLKPIYTWNRGLTESKQAFVNGDLAFYFGPASELAEIQSKNPNLNFDVATIPQPQNASVKKTVGTVYSFSVLAASRNQRAALGALVTLTSPDAVTLAMNSTRLPPARRDLLSQVPGSGSGAVFWRSALWTTTWLDPDPKLSDEAFRGAVDSIVTGAERVTQSSKSLAGKIDEIIRNSKLNEF